MNSSLNYNKHTEVDYSSGYVPLKMFMLTFYAKLGPNPFVAAFEVAPPYVSKLFINIIAVLIY